jgi:hypothetical protein
MDFKKFKESLSIADVITVVEYFGGELKEENSQYLRFTSILYHKTDASRHKGKMYYYIDSCCFHDYKLGESFDILEFVAQMRIEQGFVNTTAFNSFNIIRQILGKDFTKIDNNKGYDYKRDMGRYCKKRNAVVPEYYSSDILNMFSDEYHEDWIKDNISIATMKKYNIKYCAWRSFIVIPCYDINNSLVGIRVRNLDPDSECKYMPLIMLNGDKYSFPTGEYLYGINHTYKKIKSKRKVILFESEKSVLQMDSYFGEDNFSVALYGSALTKSKLKQLLKLNVEEIIVGYDFDYEEIDSEEFVSYIKKLQEAVNMIKPYCKVSYMIDYEPHKFKSSPTDTGKENFIRLYNNREVVDY